MTAFIANLWNRFCSKQTPTTIMIIGLDNSGKTSILNSLHSITTTSCQQHESSPAPTFKSSDIPEQKQQQQRQEQDLLTDDSDAKATSNRELSSFYGGKNSIAGEEDSLLNEADEFSKHASSTSRPVLENKLSKLSGSSLRRKSYDSYSPTVGYNFERLNYKGQTLNVLDISGQSKYRNLWPEFYNCVDAIVFVIDSSDTIRLVVVRDELENTLNHPYFNTLQQNEQQDSSDTTSEIDSSSNSSAGKGNAIGDASLFDGNRMRHPSQAFDLVQKQLTISDGKLIQSPLDRGGFKKLTTSQQQSSSTAVQPKQQRRRQSAGTLAASSNCRPTMGHGLRTRVPILFLANKTDLTNSVDTEVIVKALNLSHMAKGRHPWHIQATSVKTSQGLVEGFDWLLGQLISTKT